MQFIEAMETGDLDAQIEEYISEGYRLEMIFPADSPRVAELSRGDERIRIESAAKPASDGEWHVGRAGMEYRDLIPDRLGGKVIASHIRIPKGGPIPDYVHFHHVDFQVIYCLAGGARLVYEDQGAPFDFVAGDCVFQPSGIRHRVLECTDGFEVLEVCSPAEHPTFVEHGFGLPTPDVDRDRDFDGGKFVHHRRETASIAGESIKIRKTGILEASRGAGDVFVIDFESAGTFAGFPETGTCVGFVVSGAVTVGGTKILPGNVFAAVVTRGFAISAELSAEVVIVQLPDQSIRSNR